MCGITGLSNYGKFGTLPTVGRLSNSSRNCRSHRDSHGAGQRQCRRHLPDRSVLGGGHSSQIHVRIDAQQLPDRLRHELERFLYMTRPTGYKYKKSIFYQVCVGVNDIR